MSTTTPQTHEIDANAMVSPQLCYAMLMTILNDREFIEKHPVYFYPESQKTAVIVDPRYDTWMEAVIRNFMFFMNPAGWNLCVVSHSGYESKIKEDFPNCRFEAIDESMITIDDKGIPNISIDQYNRIFKSLSFWKTKTEHVAIFQKDCIMFRMFPAHFAEYAFAGANYYGAVSPMYGGINGGFSLRRRSAMIECIEQVSYTQIYKHNPVLETDRDRLNEDVFFTHACEILNKVVPDKITRSFLAIENDYNIDSCVFHGWNKYVKRIEFIAEILSKSPLFSKYIQTKH